MMKEAILTVIGSGVLAVCELQAQATTTPMVTLRQPRFNLGVKAGFNSSMFFTDEVSINGKDLEQAQNNYKVGYFAAVFCRFNIKSITLSNPSFRATSLKEVCPSLSPWLIQSSCRTTP